jgi:ketosteroid isomerase-like protein
MTKENGELIRRGYEAISRGDVEALKELIDPECEIHSLFGSVAGRVYRGHEGADRWYADMEESFVGVEQRPERFIEVDAERMIAVVRFRGQGRGSGAEVDQRFAVICTIRDGKGVRLETYASLDEALEAAGVGSGPPDRRKES